MLRFFCLFFFMALPLPSWAFRLSPMVVNIPMNSAQASGTYTLENNTNEKIALQFEMKERQIDRNGVETRPDTKDFLIYPEQLALAPGEKRNVRVTWQGASLPSSERAYRFVASQLPVDFAAGKAADSRNVKLRFLIEYVASLYLVPPGVKSKLRVKDAKIQKGNLEMHLVNEGSAHQLLENIKITLKRTGEVVKLTDKQLENVRTENVLAAGERWLKIPVSNMKAGDVTAELQLVP